MTSVLLRLRPALEPVVGAIFFVLWVVAEAGRFHTAADLVTLALLSLGIALASLAPWVALSAMAAVPLLQLVRVLPPPESTTWPVYFAFVIAVFFISWNAPLRVRRVSLILGVPLLVASAYLMVFPDQWSYGWTSWTGQGNRDRTAAIAGCLIAFVGLSLYVGAWTAGLAIRLNVTELRGQLLLRRTAAELGVAEVELRIAKERDRIARDVHDVLAHSLAVVIAQADGARFLGSARPQAADDALIAIADAARAALVDVRSLIEALREDPGLEPQPRFLDITDLIARVAAAGMQIGATHHGEIKPMTPAQELAVYRIIQESLTNSLRHGGRHSSTEIVFDWRGPGLAITVASRDTGGSTLNASKPQTAGHGIRGMQDRARLAGGWLTAGSATVGEHNDNDDDAADTDEASFLVTVFIPVGEPSAGDTALTRVVPA